MSWIVGIGAKLLGLHPAIEAAWNWLRASTTHILIALLAAALVWGWIGHHEEAKWKRVADSCAQARKADHASYVAAQQQAGAAQIAATKAVEASYKQKADLADETHHIALADAQRAAGEYIAAHRLPAHVDRSPGSAPAPAQGGDPGTGPDVSAPALVGVSDTDVQACGSDYEYALTLRAWALSLEATP